MAVFQTNDMRSFLGIPPGQRIGLERLVAEIGVFLDNDPSVCNALMKLYSVADKEAVLKEARKELQAEGLR